MLQRSSLSDLAACLAFRRFVRAPWLFFTTFATGLVGSAFCAGAGGGVACWATPGTVIAMAAIVETTLSVSFVGMADAPLGIQTRQGATRLHAPDAGRPLAGDRVRGYLAARLPRFASGRLSQEVWRPLGRSERSTDSSVSARLYRVRTQHRSAIWSSVALIVAASAIAGCSQLPYPQLPDATVPEKVLSKDEQQGKVNEMNAKAQNHQTQAAKEIEAGK